MSTFVLSTASPLHPIPQGPLQLLWVRFCLQWPRNQRLVLMESWREQVWVSQLQPLFNCLKAPHYPFVSVAYCSHLPTLAAFHSHFLTPAHIYPHLSISTYTRCLPLKPAHNCPYLLTPTDSHSYLLTPAVSYSHLLTPATAPFHLPSPVHFCPHLLIPAASTHLPHLCISTFSCSPVHSYLHPLSLAHLLTPTTSQPMSCLVGS